MGRFIKNSWYEWSKYEKSLKLYPPLSFVPGLVAVVLAIAFIVAFIGQFAG